MIVKIDSKREQRIVIGTHSGIFHSDEVLAVAMLCLYNDDKEIVIKRSRDAEELKKCNILVDIGEGAYDHHQPGGNGKRENGIPYASAGLVWKDVGKEVIKKLTANIKLKEDWEMYNILKEEIDDEIISKVDAEDNGRKLEKHTFSYIESFLPAWYEAQDYDRSFVDVLSITIEMLRQEIICRIERWGASAEIKSRTHFVFDSEMEKEPYLLQNILELPNQKIPWLEPVVKHNEETLEDKEKIDFVIFEYPDGGWAAQCVPPSLEEKFKQRIPFPKEWAGQTTALPEISGVKEATFCHNERFFVRAETKEAVKALCVAAMNQKE